MSDQSYTILLVEDNTDDAVLLQRAFTKARLRSGIQVVPDGEKAISYLLGEKPYDDRATHPLPALILLDLKLPGKSGLEVLEWLRQQPDEIRNIPVIVLTASRQSDDIQRAYALGAYSYMAKPSGNYDGLPELVRKLEG